MNKIAAFGGDPGNVTIWGESAGAACVTLQPLIKGSQQYFQKVIAQSGAPSQTNSVKESIATTNDLMEALGCKTVADMTKVDARRLVDTAAKVVALRIFPVRDGRTIPFDPWETYESGIAKDSGEGIRGEDCGLGENLFPDQLLYVVMTKCRISPPLRFIIYLPTNWSFVTDKRWVCYRETLSFSRARARTISF
ncbi:MAG: carboxylesterase family protein [Prevotella sp.]|nr:carboxylesterase family protein [Prevotella sp.]